MNVTAVSNKNYDLKNQQKSNAYSPRYSTTLPKQNNVSFGGVMTPVNGIFKFIQKTDIFVFKTSLLMMLFLIQNVIDYVFLLAF